VNSGVIRLQNFLAAVIAHGDIAFSDLSRYPHDLAVGLRIGTGRPASDQWRQILDGKAALRAPALSRGFVGKAVGSW
jgi:hypothetical protein